MLAGAVNLRGCQPLEKRGWETSLIAAQLPFLAGKKVICPFRACDTGGSGCRSDDDDPHQRRAVLVGRLLHCRSFCR